VVRVGWIWQAGDEQREKKGGPPAVPDPIFAEPSAEPDFEVSCLLSARGVNISEERFSGPSSPEFFAG